MIDVIVAVVCLTALAVWTIVVVASEWYTIKIKMKILKGVEVVENAYNDWKD